MLVKGLRERNSFYAKYGLHETFLTVCIFVYTYIRKMNDLMVYLLVCIENAPKLLEWFKFGIWTVRVPTPGEGHRTYLSWKYVPFPGDSNNRILSVIKQ